MSADSDTLAPSTASGPALRIVVLGTGAFIVPTFEALLATRHQIVAVVTQPRREVRPGRFAPDAPMRVAAEKVAAERPLPLYDPPSINTPESIALLQSLTADLLVVADYGQILKPETLATARLGGINLHGSLLPRHRGAAPVNWAIWLGDAETGVTVIHMTPRLDAGPTLAQAATPIDPAEDAVALERRLALLGAPLVVEVVDALAAGRETSLPQSDAAATHARKLRKTDGEIDWSQSAQQIVRQVRALEPWPRAATYWHRTSAEPAPPLRLIIHRAEALDAPVAAKPAELESSPTTHPGTLLSAERGELLVATGQGVLRVVELQPESKRRMTAAEFLRGAALAEGTRFGPL